jgi:hypothetical protein
MHFYRAFSEHYILCFFDRTGFQEGWWALGASAEYFTPWKDGPCTSVVMPWCILRKHGQLLLGTDSFLWLKLETESFRTRILELEDVCNSRWQHSTMLGNYVSASSRTNSARYKSRLWCWRVVGGGTAWMPTLIPIAY